MSGTVFHVDDAEDIRFAVHSILSAEGYNVLSFETVEDLFDSVGKSDSDQDAEPDVIILDVMVEECDSGLKMFDAIKEKFPQIPIVMLTSLGEMIRQYFFNRPDTVWILEKPIVPDTLISAIKANIDK